MSKFLVFYFVIMEGLSFKVEKLYNKIFVTCAVEEIYAFALMSFLENGVRGIDSNAHCKLVKFTLLEKHVTSRLGILGKFMGIIL